MWSPSDTQFIVLFYLYLTIENKSLIQHIYCKWVLQMKKKWKWNGPSIYFNLMHLLTRCLCLPKPL